MKFTDDSDFARSMIELHIAQVAQMQRIADAFERALPLLENVANPPDADPIARAMAYLHQHWETTSQREYAAAVGYSKSAIFPDKQKLAKRLAGGYKPAETDSLRGLYESFTASRDRRRGFNDGDGNVDGVEY